MEMRGEEIHLLGFKDDDVIKGDAFLLIYAESFDEKERCG